MMLSFASATDPMTACSAGISATTLSYSRARAFPCTPRAIEDRIRVWLRDKILAGIKIMLSRVLA